MGRGAAGWVREVVVSDSGADLERKETGLAPKAEFASGHDSITQRCAVNQAVIHPVTCRTPCLYSFSALATQLAVDAMCVCVFSPRLICYSREDEENLTSVCHTSNVKKVPAGSAVWRSCVAGSWRHGGNPLCGFLACFVRRNVRPGVWAQSVAAKGAWCWGCILGLAQPQWMVREKAASAEKEEGHRTG